MFTQLLGQVKELARQERAKAIESHRTYFASSWESVAKLEEEITECGREMREIENRHSMIKYRTFEHSTDFKHELAQLLKHAEFLACEAIQVAAVTRKTLASLELWNDYGEMPLTEENWINDMENDKND